MKTLPVFWTLAALVVASLAAVAEPIDPDPDGMSFYFDTEATDYCLHLDYWLPGIEPGPTATAYLIVTRPDTPHPSVLAWEAHIDIVTNSYTPPTGLTLTPGATVYDQADGDYVVGCYGDAAILITGDAVVIAWVDVAWLGFEGFATAGFFLGAIEGSESFPDGPGYESGPGLFSIPQEDHAGPQARRREGEHQDRRGQGPARRALRVRVPADRGRA